MEIRALIALIYLLPPSAKGKKSKNNDTIVTAINKFIVFKKVFVRFTSLNLYLH